MIEEKHSPIPAAGIGLILGAGAVAAAAVALGLYVASRTFYPIVLAPIIAGLIVGVPIGKAALAGKVRSTVLIGLAGLLAGVGGVIGYHYLSYSIGFPNDIRSELEFVGAPTDDETVERTRSFILEDETGSDGFLAFVKLEAQNGLTVSGSSSSDSGIALEGTAAWIYYGVEALIIAAVSLFTARVSGTAEWDEETRQFFTKRKSQGFAGMEFAGRVERALEAQDMSTLLSLLDNETKPRKQPKDRIEVTIFDVPKADSSTVVLTAETVSGKGDKEKRTPIYSDRMPREKLNATTAADAGA